MPDPENPQVSTPRNDPIKFQDNPNLYSLNRPFALEKADYMVLKITNASDTYNTLSRIVLAPTIWWGITCLAKMIKGYFWENKDSIDPWEIILLILGIGVYLLLLCRSKRVPNERKELLKEIEGHFKEDKRRIGTVSEDDRERDTITT